MPAAEVLAFPDTPSSSFWSGTPGAGSSSFGIHFLRGAVRSLPRATQAHVRLVRDSGETPRQPLPAVRLARPPPVLEGDSGTTSLVFPVLLDRPAATDVTVDFQTFDHTAVAGQDYLATSGTLLIPAGAVRAEISVPVLGDTVAEPNESFRLVLSSISPNARLMRSRQFGGIRDDEPRLRAWPADVHEGSAGTTDLLFGVTLSRASATDVSVDFATSDGTATAGSDYTATSGRLTIPAGQTLAFIHVPVIGDAAAEGDETVLLTLSNPSANALLGSAVATGAILEDDAPRMTGWNDTGVTTCGDAQFYNLRCPVAGFPGQDAQFGRNTLAFTKLDAAGAALPVSAATWACVRDDVTGLVWEVHPDDAGLRDRDWTYTWYRSTGIDDGGSAGTANGGTCFDTANCDTEKYVGAVNAAGLCGASDWRLPSWEELHSLDDLGNGGGAPNRTSFNDAPGGLFANSYWTATSVSSGGASALSIQNLSGGSTSGKTKSSALQVRLVRGGN